MLIFILDSNKAFYHARVKLLINISKDLKNKMDNILMYLGEKKYLERVAKRPSFCEKLHFRQMKLA